MPVTHIYTQLLAKEAAKLGRITLNLQSPEQDFHDSPALTSYPPNSIEKHQVNLGDRWVNNGPANPGSTLAKALAMKVGGKNTETILDSAVVSTYQLMNSTDLYESICSVESTRKWFEKRVIARDKTAYMMVGYETLGEGAHVHTYTARQTARDKESISSDPAQEKKNVSDPDLTQSRRQYGDVYVEGGFVHQGDNFGTVHHNHYSVFPQSTNTTPEWGMRQTSLGTLDTQICAIQYRQIKFNWLRSKDLGAARLQKGTIWKQYYGTRDQADSEDEDEEEELDVIQAELVDLEKVPNANNSVVFEESSMHEN